MVKQGLHEATHGLRSVKQGPCEAAHGSRSLPQLHRQTSTYGALTKTFNNNNNGKARPRMAY